MKKKTLRQRLTEWMLGVLDAFTKPAPCGHPGCEQPSRGFRYPYSTESDVWFNWCRDHAGAAGFCWVCGGFFLGIDEDIEEIGVCAECRKRETAKPEVDTDGPPWQP
jgi:hypothetical protein